MSMFGHTSPIGLDVGERDVSAVQLDCRQRIAAAANFPRSTAGAPVDGEQVRRIMEVLARRGFKGNRVVLPVPSEKLINSVLEVPAKTAPSAVEPIARMELARANRCPPDSFEMGCWTLPAATRSGRPGQVMAVGCAHRDANTLLETFEAEGLEVVALDVRASALARAARPLLPRDNAVSAVLDVGWEGSMLVMVHGGAVVYGRLLSDGGLKALGEALRTRLSLEQDVTDYLLAEVGMAPAPADEDAVNVPQEARNLLIAHVDALVQELNISFSYVAHEYPDVSLSRVLLTGTGATMPGLAEHLSNVLGVEVPVASASQLAACRPALLPDCASPALVAALGLAAFREE